MNGRAGAAISPGTVVESGVRLSRSRLWQMQRRFFESAGIDAWRLGIVPHHITSNPAMGDAYARLIEAFARDTADANSPLYIVELGAGAGRLAFQILSALGDQLDVRYVMTDFVESTIAAWRALPGLARFVERGVLDFARFDIERDRELTLQIAGTTLSPASRPSRLVVIANYVFDGLRQDVFRRDRGRLCEGLVELWTPQPACTDLDDPALLDALQLRYRYQPLARPCYDEPMLAAGLERWSQRLGAGAACFPVGALDCCQRMRALSDRVLLLTADKGFATRHARVELEHPAVTVHGSISLDVDYSCIADWCNEVGGTALLPGRASSNLVVAAFLVGELGDMDETIACYQASIDEFGPDDYHALKQRLLAVLDRLPLAAVLALLRVGGGDARLLQRCLPALHQHLPTASEGERDELVTLARETWSRYLPLGEADDLAFDIGTLLAMAERSDDALPYLMHSLERFGLDPNVTFNIALCHRQRGATAEAVHWLEATLALDPAHERATHERAAALRA